MNSFDEFKSLWNKEKPRRHKKAFDHLIFIVAYPDNLKWSFIVEKQTQTTCLHTSGGNTGAGTGHKQILCYQSEVNDILKKCKETHAMIVTVGMIFDMLTPHTAIYRFHRFAKGNEFCKAHIIAKPNRPAYLNHQHIELNLNLWKSCGAPDIFSRWKKFERANDNFHDDYTPSWIKIDGLPIIKNFTSVEREGKAFAYHMANRTEGQNKNWNIIREKSSSWRDQVDLSDNYFKLLMNRFNEKFYVQNTESLSQSRQLPKDEFDLIITPTAGYSGEVFAEVLNFNGDIIFYDYMQENLDIKEIIVNMNMSFDDIRKYSKSLPDYTIFFNSDVPDHHVQSTEMKERAKTFGTEKDVVRLQKKLFDNCDIEYWLMDIISPDYDKIIKRVKGKKVFFDISNIFSYHVSHACYTLEELVNSLNKLESILNKYTEHYYLKGTKPTKQWIKHK